MSDLKEYLIMLPGPTNVPARVSRAMCRPLVSHRGEEFRELMERITENAKEVFMTKSDIYVLTASGTGGVEAAVSNLFWKGDKVLVPILGVFSERLAETVERRGAEVIRVNVEWGDAVSAEKVKEVMDGVRDLTAIALTYNDTSTGVTVRELREIGKLSRDRGTLLMVDAISILGGDELPVDEWNVDVCVTGSQKCLACPPGLSLISVSENAWEKISSMKNRPFYFDLISYKEFYEKKRETPYTPAIPLFYALDEALRIILEEGIWNRIRRHRTCAKAFYRAIEALNLRPFSREEVRSNTVIAVKNPEGISDSDIRRLMRERFRILIAGGMGRLSGTMFRIGNMGIVSGREVLYTISALEDVLSMLGFDFDRGSGVSAVMETMDEEGGCPLPP